MDQIGLKRDSDHKRQIEELRDRGDTFDLRTDSSEVLGVALKSSQDATKPVFVSVGHRLGWNWLEVRNNAHRFHHEFIT